MPDQAPGSPAFGPGSALVNMRTTNTSTSRAHARALSQRQICSTTDGTNSSHRHTPTSKTHEIGRKYFRQVIITWSMRRRGSDQRIHIITKTRNQPLSTNTITFRTCPNQPSRSDGSKGNSPLCQPPRNRIAAAPLTANMLEYSAKKNIDQRIPLYSV